MSKNLTQRQQQIYDFLVKEVKSKGYPPSVREIGAEIGLSSSSTVHSHLTALERKGFIKRDPTKPRALLLSNLARETTDDSLSIPLIGEVAAGQPLLATENIVDHIGWGKNLGSTPSFALAVKGESMINDGILDGDIVMVRSQKTAENGEIVVALLENDATVKRFYLEKDRIRLEPANPAFSPIYSSDATIIGKVVGLLRRI